MMKTLLKSMLLAVAAIPTFLNAQTNLTLGFNYSYNGPSNCNNQLTAISIDVCNTGSSAAGSFIVGLYLYKPSTQEYWVLDNTPINSLSGNACVNINNWNIDMNQYPSLPAPGTNYRIGVWIDTANTVTETDENNNSYLLDGNIQVCAAPTGIKKYTTSVSKVDVSPNPVNNTGTLNFQLTKEEETEIVLIDVTGKKVKTVFSGKLFRGAHTIEFTTEDVSEGIYLLQIRSGDSFAIKKIVVQK